MISSWCHVSTTVLCSIGECLQEIFVVLESDEAFWADSELSGSDDEPRGVDDEISADVSSFTFINLCTPYYTTCSAVCDVRGYRGCFGVGYVLHIYVHVNC